MKSSSYILLILALILFGLWWWQKSPDETGEVVYETVSFCGTEYEAPVIMVDGVDFIKRIAEIASAEKSEETCNYIKSTSSSNLGVSFVERPNLNTLHLNGHLFDIDLVRRVIMRPGEHGTEDWDNLE